MVLRLLHGRSAARRAAVSAALGLFLTGCADRLSTLRSSVPVAVVEVPAGAAALAACLAAAYRGDGFGVAVTGDADGRRALVTAYGMPAGAGRALRPSPRLEIAVEDAGAGRARAAFRTAWTLLGPGRDAATFRRRATGCAADLRATNSMATGNRTAKP